MVELLDDHLEYQLADLTVSILVYLMVGWLEVYSVDLKDVDMVALKVLLQDYTTVALLAPILAEV